MQIYLSNTNAIDLQDQRIAWLSSDERRRLERKRSPAAQRNFLASRLLMRAVLANHLDCHPEVLEFSVSDSGKPVLVPSLTTATELSFNLSHSANRLALAVGSSNLGVDIEVPGRSRDLLGIAERFFHPDEYTHLSSLTEPARSTAFYRYWTLKEAFFKARGTGIAEGLAEVCIDARHTIATLTPVLADTRTWHFHYWQQPLGIANCHLALVADEVSTAPTVTVFEL